jgi:hypothetical protein
VASGRLCRYLRLLFGGKYLITKEKSQDKNSSAYANMFQEV